MNFVIVKNLNSTKKSKLISELWLHIHRCHQDLDKYLFQSADHLHLSQTIDHMGNAMIYPMTGSLFEHRTGTIQILIP